MEKHCTFPVLASSGITKYYGGSHGGVDIGWKNTPDEKLIAVRSGDIVWSEYTTYGGNVIALEFPVDEYNKQWVLYQHCKNLVKTRTGVKQGEVIGIMGNTGESYGNHLHFTMCKPQPKSTPFSYSFAINNTINPLNNILFALIGVDYDLSKTDRDLKQVEWFSNIEPVDRDEYVNQINVKGSTLRMRTTPNDDNYDNVIGSYCPMGYFNVLASQKTERDWGDTWYKIDEDVWVAGVSYVEYLPKKEDVDYKKLYEDAKAKLDKIQGVLNE